ncbi:MAG: DUF4304 domain-containing protein, partial [Myxococcota bacterium]
MTESSPITEPRVPSRETQDGAEAAVAEALERRLAPLGFVHEGVHFVREREGVAEVVEAQHSVYGTRLTANLGLDLVWLRPLVRWIRRPDLGPHAHDCVRWIRVGLVEDRRGDRWWSYEPEDGSSLATAADGLAERVAGPGLSWLGRERESAAFLQHAQRCVERSRSRIHPEGGYLELRLLAAVHAWRGDFARAGALCARAGTHWEEERARLVMARDIYRRRHPNAPARLPPVPNLQRELERITEPTTGARALRR